MPNSINQIRSDFKRLFSGELDFDRADVLSDGSHVLIGTLATGVDPLRVDTVLGVQILYLTAGEHPVKLVLDLVLSPQSSPQGQALLLPGKLKQVRPFSHYCGATGGHLEDLFFGRSPCDDEEFFNLCFSEEPTCATTEDRRWCVWIKLRWNEPNRGILFGCFLLGGDAGCAE